MKRIIPEIDKNPPMKSTLATISLFVRPLEFTYHFSQQQPYVVPGGSVKIVDTTTFPIATEFAAALVTVEPGAMHELHWHLTSDEWNFFIQGSARITLFNAPDASRTFDYTAGDVGFIPVAQGHYIENTGTKTLSSLKFCSSRNLRTFRWRNGLL